MIRSLSLVSLLPLFIACSEASENANPSPGDGNTNENGSGGLTGGGSGGLPGAQNTGGSVNDGGTGGSGSTVGVGGSGGASTGGAGSGGAGTGGNGTGGAGTGGAGSGGAGTGGNGTGGAGLPDDVTTPKIMIVGDSISAGPGCYKKYLAEKLTMNGHSFEFVGAYADDCGGGVMHSAVSCTTSGQFTQGTFTVPNCFAADSFSGMAPLMAAHQPDIVMVQLGVNDVWSGSAPIAPILDNYSTLVEQVRAENPNAVIFIAQIHRIMTDNCSNSASTANAQQLIEAVPGWAAGITTSNSPVLVADLWTNSDAMEAGDCVHPNDAGAQRMAGNWYQALAPIVP